MSDKFRRTEFPGNVQFFFALKCKHQCFALFVEQVRIYSRSVIQRPTSSLFCPIKKLLGQTHTCPFLGKIVCSRVLLSYSTIHVFFWMSILLLFNCFLSLLNIRAIEEIIKLPKQCQSMGTFWILIQLRINYLIETLLTSWEKIEIEFKHILIKTNVSRWFKSK